MGIRRRVFDPSVEERVLTGVIMSDRMCREVLPILKGDYFSSKVSGIIYKWCRSYFEDYQKAPGATIQDIYQIERSNYSEEERELVASFLDRLSSKFEADNVINEDFYIDTGKEFIRKRALEAVTDQLGSLLKLDRLDEAEEALRSYKGIAKTVSPWYNPLDESEIIQYFIDENMQSNALFRFPGALGDLMGDIERNSLFAVLAPTKRGKTFWLQEFAVQTFMERIPTVFFSLEMNSHRLKRRLYRRITSLGDRDGAFIYPCFDCARNQDGTCTSPKRTNDVRLLDGSGLKPEFSVELNYRPCTACRGVNGEFVPDTWFTVIRKDGRLTRKTAGKVLKNVGRIYGDRLRYISFPAFSANIREIRSAIDHLIYLEEFVPSVIVIDYADILAPEDSRVTGRDRLDMTWKTLKNLADSYNALVVTASQSNRASFDKKNVTQTDIADDIRKVAHVDGMIALNQLEEEKRRGIMRVSYIAGRDHSFDQRKSCVVLQQLDLGQTLLDSEFMRERSSEVSEECGDAANG